MSLKKSKICKKWYEDVLSHPTKKISFKKNKDHKDLKKLVKDCIPKIQTLRNEVKKKKLSSKGLKTKVDFLKKLGYMGDNKIDLSPVKFLISKKKSEQKNINCDIWKKNKKKISNNKVINPETGRKIEKGKATYNKIEKLCSISPIKLYKKKTFKKIAFKSLSDDKIMKEQIKIVVKMLNKITNKFEDDFKVKNWIILKREGEIITLESLEKIKEDFSQDYYDNIIGTDYNISINVINNKAYIGIISNNGKYDKEITKVITELY